MKLGLAVAFMVVAWLGVVPTAVGAPRAVTESARDLPVAYDVDIVVVGGSTGAVSAGVSAAEAGAEVFLAAPRPYLGEDAAGTLRVWLEDGETPSSPLAKAIYAERYEPGPIMRPELMLPFTYRADRASGDLHKDTMPPSKLSDGQWRSAIKQSVQYDGDPTITVDLKTPQAVERTVVLLYHHSDFSVESVTAHASTDGTAWKQVAAVANPEPAQGGVDMPAIPLSVPVGCEARYLKFAVKRAKGSKRVLLGEFVVLKPGPAVEETAPPQIAPARPLLVKRVLDQALLDADVPFLYGSVATDVLRDSEGNPCGIVMANRAGRQAVLARVIVDATDRAWVARMAGANAAPFPAGRQTVRRVVVGGKIRTDGDVVARKVPPPFRRGTLLYDVIEYTLKIPMRDGGHASWAVAEQTARDMTYHPDQQFTSDVLFQAPPDPIKGQATVAGPWGCVDGLDIGAFRPAGVSRLFVLGGCADISREQAAKLLRPVNLIDMGARIGKAAAGLAKTLAEPKTPTLPGGDMGDALAGDVREILTGVRPTEKPKTIRQAARPLPILGEYDVVVVGGGTGGAPAGIAAARQGAKTLVVEYLYGLGGVGTMGAISKYYWGNRVGFTAKVPGGASWRIEQKMEWWRKTLREAGADIWFGTLGCGVFVDGDRVRGAVVATPEGRGVVLAKVVIDSTGNADMAAAGGAPCVYTDKTDIAMQGTGLPPRLLGASYTNTDYTIVDETDMMDVWHVMVYAKVKAAGAFDIGQLIDTRERRRILGDFTISILDQVNGRTYPDTVVEAHSNFDTHGYTVHPFFTLQYPHKKGIRSHIPYRALLPKGLDGILVTGLGKSVHRDALPVTRMQPDIQNEGYAAGVAAAMTAKAGAPTRKIDIRALQAHLVKIGNLPESVLTDEDSYPMPTDRIAEAVATACEGYEGVAVLLANPDRALPMLRDTYEAATSDAHKLAYAHILAVMGDATGLDRLAAAVNAMPGLDEGWHYRGMGQFGASFSRLDSLTYAMGRARDRRAVPAIVAKLKLLTDKDAFSHHRALAMALERIGDPSAAGALAEVLSRPGVRGHAVTHVEKAIARERESSSWTATEPRSNALRELILARALYRCGDKDGLGKAVLTEYTKDLRGHWARHARAVLDDTASH